MDKIVYRPKAGAYIAMVAIIYAALALLLAVAVWLIAVSMYLLGVICLVIALIAAVWASVEVALYKLVIFKDKVIISENRIFSSIRQAEVALDFTGLCEIKYTSAIGEDGRTVPAIAFFYADGMFRYINVKRFNQSQIAFIMSDIKRLAEAKTGREVGILDCDRG